MIAFIIDRTVGVLSKQDLTTLQQNLNVLLSKFWINTTESI